jgi:hypothetical protein
MLRFSSIVWMIAVAFAASGLYMVKYRVQFLHERVEHAERSLREQKEAIHVLDAEWTYLNRPERLRRLSEKYLSLQPADPKQIAELDDIPLRGAAPQPASGEVTLPLTHAKAVMKGHAGYER